MRLFTLALALSLADLAVASAQTATPDNENGRYSFNPVADGVLRLDTRTGQVSQCSREPSCTPSRHRSGCTRDRGRPPTGRDRDAEEGTVGPWAVGTRSAESVRYETRRA